MLGQGVDFRSLEHPGRSCFATHVLRDRNDAADELAKKGVLGESQECWQVELLQQYCTCPCDYLCLVSFDGGASPNPGPAGCGSCVWLASNRCFREDVQLTEQSLQWQLLHSSSSHLGLQSNIYAEWHGLLSGLLAVIRIRTVV